MLTASEADIQQAAHAMGDHECPSTEACANARAFLYQAAREMVQRARMERGFELGDGAQSLDSARMLRALARRHNQADDVGYDMEELCAGCGELPPCSCSAMR